MVFLELGLNLNEGHRLKMKKILENRVGQTLKTLD